MGNILLATFCVPKLVLANCKKLWELFPDEESLDKIFLLGVKGTAAKKILTYNISQESLRKIDYKTIFPGTVQIHRKEKTNTLYTINAINAIQKKEVGIVDKNYKIDWESYKETFLIEIKEELHIYHTVLERIFDRNYKRDERVSNNHYHDEGVLVTPNNNEDDWMLDFQPTEN